MNEKNFIRKLKKDNSHDEEVCKIILELIEEEQRHKGMIERIINGRGATPKEIIKNNFELILSKMSRRNAKSIIQLLTISDEYTDIVKQNKENIINRLQELSSQNNTYGRSLFNKELFSDLRKVFPSEAEFVQFMEKHVDDILKTIPAQNIFEEIQNLKGISNKIDARLNKYLENDKVKNEIAKRILKTMKLGIIISKLQEEVAEENAPVIAQMIDELVQSEHIRWIDVVKVQKTGKYNDVYEIGNKVLKVGELRETYHIPNHKRILQPLTRINLLYRNNSARPYACVEISDKIQRVSQEDTKKEELYQVYKELRDAGIIWTDVDFDNVGRLIKSNSSKHKLNGEEIDVVPRAVGFTNNEQVEDLGPGNLVVLDTDYLYAKDDPKIRWLNKGFAMEFEEQWLHEQQAKIAEEFRNKTIEEKGHEDNERIEE